ncbi:CDP-glycerol glycerophosphotransferase family protein [Candidatus Enterococcus willemsii]|uniref:CDP-glycerol--UDP-pyrophosphoryl-N-acetylglucosaminyl-N-acetylmannosamine glycerophosphotransferase n=1 Tax=Candidatus Enterococcus willemsii TaxID=1857215 RepID=A0ABQ6Z193_9ENTE|nr:CDP-glycerol glycerophosphotransferase family protein [Enterococcus sp. CU12B]KAF1305057.1 CDP-glycerol--UDP-pyrophosphoryl-N-acetylglucosaminyl-N-acetylmannosamine glycerophosphotransferase [Enterococcus sp. CU12B]
MKKIINCFKSVYLFLVKLRGKYVKKRHEKVIFLLSFPTTSKYMLEALMNKSSKEFIICYTKNSKSLALEYKQKGYQVHDIYTMSSLLGTVVPLVKGAKFILCDNYYAFLGGINFFDDTKIVQLWHAAGAIKSFGLEAKYAQQASDLDRKRYKETYNKYTHYMVSSNEMKNVFERSYETLIEFLPFGYIPSDKYFDQDWIEKVKKEFVQKFGQKKTLLYVPTYREKNNENPIDFSSITKQIGHNWQILVKAHPHDSKFQNKIQKNSEIITDFKGMTLQEILPSVDCLITDYSSVPFEYSLANPNGKMIFFCYDLEMYRNTVGIQPGFLEWIPGPLVINTHQLIEAIEDEGFKFTEFNQLWNQFNEGNATEKLMEWVENYND